MPDSDLTPGPRRSQREKKRAKPFTSIETSSTKRKRTDSDTEDQDEGLEDLEDNQPESDGDEVEGEYQVAKPKPKPTMTARKTKMKTRGPPPAKKPRQTKARAVKSVKATIRKSKKAPPLNDAFDAAKISLETKIASDNPLFNAVMNPSSALQSIVEDFLESLSQTPNPAQAELINFVLRACGCNDSVDADEVVDYDGVVDALDTFTEGLKKDDSPIYPLTSKLPVFKKFRKSLSEFLERLIVSSAELGSLYSTDIIITIQTWVVAMSSSQIRSFRHTATVIALEVETALCDVAATVEKEAEVIGRQREGERKRKANNKGIQAREKQLESKAAEVREQRTMLAEFLKEFVDAVFVHRYRDLDPNIRAECVRSIGLWFKKYPGHFLDGSYLRYVGWVLSDNNTLVRLEAVNALSGVYDQADYISSLNHFTERFKPRLIEMATGDTELGVRVSVIKVLKAIDEHSLLEDEEREKLCLLVFDEEARVRKAVSGFVRGVWEDIVEELLAGRKVGKQDRDRAGVKAFGMLLVKWSNTLEKVLDGESSGDDDNAAAGSSQIQKAKEVASLVGLEQKGRTALAVEALWEEVEPASNWETLLDVLHLDHSAAGVDTPATSRGKGKEKEDNSIVDEAWRLEEVEESVLLEVLVATLRRAQADVVSTKKGEENGVTSDITRELIKGLPHLFIKYQADQNRIANVLLIPPLMNLDLYLEMRMITSYANLWDDVSKQFLTHSSPKVLGNAVGAIRHFMNATSLSNTNSTKVLELEDELSTLLRDAVAGREEIEVASFTEDEVLALSALCTRLAVLSGTRNMVSWMEENEGGKQSCAWDIISALVDRGRLGYKEEETMVDQAIQLLTLHIIWKARGLTADPGTASPEEGRMRDALKEQRDSLLEKLIEYAVGTQSNTAEGVKRAAFSGLINLHILFSASHATAADGALLPIASLTISLDDEVQYRCAGFVQAEIERYAEDYDDGTSPRDGQSAQSENSESDLTDEEVDRSKKQKTKPSKGVNGKNGVSGDNKTPRTRLEQEYIFMGVMSTFLRAIRAGAIHFRHTAVLLAHYGRLGIAFDTCAKVVIDVLKEEGMLRDNGDIVVDVITQALQESFTLVLDGVVNTENHSVALAKSLSSCFLIRGAQLAVIRRLEGKFVIQIHTDLLTWITKRITTYESIKNKKSKKTAILFFRALYQLLSSVESRDALSIKAHMDQLFAQSKIEVPSTSKVWESQRAYEKRLGTTISKDKSQRSKGKKRKGAKGGALATTDEETGGESGGEGLGNETDEPAPPLHPRPRPRPRRRAANKSVAAEGADSAPEGGESDAVAGPDPVREPSTIDPMPTPQARRLRATYGSQSPAKSRNLPPARTPSRQTSVTDMPADELTTPSISRKRPHSEDRGDDGESNQLPSINGLGDLSSLSPTPSMTSLPATPANDIQFRLKRARR